MSNNILIIPGSWNYFHLNRIHEEGLTDTSYIYVFLIPIIYEDFKNTKNFNKVKYYKLYEIKSIENFEYKDEVVEFYKNVGYGELILGDTIHYKYKFIPQKKELFTQGFYMKSICFFTYYFDNIIRENSISLVFYEMYNNHFGKIIYHVSEYHKIQALYPSSAVFKNRTMFYNGKDGSDKMFTELLKIKISNNKFNYNSEVNELFNKVLENKTAYDEYEYRNKIRISKSNLLFFLKLPLKLIKLFFNNIYKDFNEYTQLDFLTHKQNYVTLFNLELKAFFSNIWYKKNSSFTFIDNQSIYFMHYQPEATTHGIAPYYTDEINNIVSIAKALPLGMILYVRDHPASGIPRGKKYFKELKYQTNVKLISQDINPITLIKSSRLIFTVSGTVAIEAAILRKPVVVFSNVIHNCLPNVSRVSKIEDLPVLINKLISDSFSMKLNSDEFENFVKMYLDTLLDNSFYTVQNSDYSDFAIIEMYRKELNKYLPD
jgi:hypothetical protein